MVREVEIRLFPVWARMGVLLLTSAALVWGIVQLTARVRGAQMANLVGGVQTLKLALIYDPGQADVHTRLGTYYLYDPFLFDPVQAVHHFEMAVRLQPFQFRAWSDLGRAYEQRNDPVRAERAYQVSIALAPNYFYPRWAYANFLLRRGNLSRAFAEFRRVADIAPESTQNICEFVRQATGGQVEALTEFGRQLRSGWAKWGICQCLAQLNDYQRAVDVWNTLAADDAARVETGRSLIAFLLEARQWWPAYQVWQGVLTSIKGDVSPADRLFWNGGFEHEVIVRGFDWTISSSQQVEASIDPTEHHQGQQSLRLEFKQHRNVSFDGIARDLWVEPSTVYRLQFYYKAEGLSEDNGLAVVVTDAETPTRLSLHSEPLGREAEWTLRQLVIETPPQTRVLRLHIVRRPTERVYDYVEGRVWFDSFSLEPLGPAPAQGAEPAGS